MENENIVWRKGESRESYQALVKQFCDYAASAKPGDQPVLPVAVCPTTRIAWDGVDRVVMLPCKVVQERICNVDRIRIAVCPPRYPKGLHPGVWVGMPLIACHDMKPMPKVKRTFRGYRRW